MYIKSFTTVLVTFAVLDAVWIGLVVRKIYVQELGDWMRSSPEVLAAGLFYLAYAAGIVYLAVLPAVNASAARIALINGAVVGALAYGTFTITNYAVLSRWSITLVFSDIAWGIFITSICAGCGYWVSKAA